jgi:hypothetical protein
MEAALATQAMVLSTKYIAGWTRHEEGISFATNTRRMNVRDLNQGGSMKREELTPIELECNMGPDVNGVEHREPWKAYDIDEVNLLLDEKDAEIEDLLRQNRELCQALQVMYSKEEYGKLQKEIESLKAKLEDARATVAFDYLDAVTRERRLRRALWLSRANNAINSYDKWNLFANFESEDKLFTIDEYDETPGVTDFSTLRTYAEWCKVWQNVGRKCLKKAELYK